uniref:TetR family transcriptional regulator n=1 Tax=Streptomyces sp. FR1 TaxID=349971 RepID=V9Z3M0_9ACTN|nr:TetR family transcriptional regulator [Streptomyces sp. FR1]AHE39137.1 tetR family transcriptional regulator [Streptomyces sp. FR1]
MNVDTAPDRQRTTVRSPGVRDTVLDIVLGMHADRTWGRTSMERIASAAGVSRQTLYNQFGSRDGVTQALLSRETGRLSYGVDRRWRQVRSRGGNPADCLTAAMSWVLAVSHDHPLLPAVLTGLDHNAACTPLTALWNAPADHLGIHGRGAGAVAAVTELCRRLDTAEHGGHPDRLRGVEAVVRLTVSYLLVPAATTRARSQIAQAARSLLPDNGPPVRRGPLNA